MNHIKKATLAIILTMITTTTFAINFKCTCKTKSDGATKKEITVKNVTSDDRAYSKLYSACPMTAGNRTLLQWKCNKIVNKK